MKYLVFLIFICTFSSFSQSGVAIYKKEMIFPKDLHEDIKETNPQKYKNFMRFKRKMEEAAKQVSFELQFSNGIGLFQSREILSTSSNDMDLGIGPNNGRFYTNSNLNEHLWETNQFGQNFLITLAPTEWIISNETKIIGGYRCIKATGEKKVRGKEGDISIPIEVWFSTDIPVNLGPIGYSQLPGLIVSLSLQNEHYYLSKLDIKKKNIEIKRPSKGKKITYSEFQELGRNLMNQRGGPQ